MRMLRVLRQRARSLFRGARVDVELASELAFHLEQLTRENVAAGMAEEEARRAARRTLGGLAQFEEQCRDYRGVGWITGFLKDVAYAGRTLRKSPGFTALAVVTLALGVGATIAVYVLAEALVLRSLPFPSPERLASIASTHVRHGDSGVGQENFRDWQASNTVFEHMAYSEFSQMTVTGLGDAERVTGSGVSAEFFETLGVPPRLGRWFTPEEQTPGAPRVILLSHGFWMRKLGGRPEAVGAIIYFNDRPYRITGVMPESFRFNDGIAAEYWTPITYRSTGRQQHQYGAYARLKPGVTLAAARAQMNEIARRQAAQLPDDAGWGVRVVSMRADFLSPFGAELGIMGAAALIVLLVACANVASLLLARGIGRAKEIAVRLAMGASRRRVVRLLLAESLLLSGLGAAAGLLLAWWLVRLAIAAAPPWLDLAAMIAVSPLVVAFALALTLTTGLLTGVWPALRGARANLHADLKESGSFLVAGRRQARSLNALVAMEIALAVVLLTFAGLLAKSFTYLLHTDLGYRPERLLTFRMPLAASRYRTDQQRVQFWQTFLPQAAAVPGVVSAAASDSIPLGGTYSGVPVEVEGQTGHRDWRDIMVRAASVTPQYFRTMGMRIEAGREFNAGDTASSGPVAIVNQEFLRNLMPEGNPVGRHVEDVYGQAKWRRIVGVMRDARYNGPTQPIDPEIYVPFTQDSYLQFVAIRTAAAQEGALAAVRGILRRMDPQLPITQVRSMRQSLEISTSTEREMMGLVAGFAAVALAMSTLGLAGVMAYTVSRRRREIGLRMALGARAGDVAAAVVGSAARLVLAGCAAGALCAWAGTRVLESLLYGVRPHDATAAIAAPLVLAFVALLAVLAPARRAASVDPMTALRQE